MSDDVVQLKLGLGLPAYGGKISTELGLNLLQLGHTLACSDARFQLRMQAIRDVCGVDRARCALIDDAIAADCDWLLMIDADTWCEDASSLLVMISEADRANASVVVAAVPRRNTDGRRELMVYNNSGVPLDDSFLHSAPEDLVRIGSAATAIMAVRMRDVVKLDKPWFRFTAEQSEDLDFCSRVRANGGLILCDRRVKARHLNRPAILAGLS